MVAALRCFTGGIAPTCTNRMTNASNVAVHGLECTKSDDITMRGFFVVSCDLSGTPVCTAGDAFHLRVVEMHGDLQFAALRP